MDTLETLRAAIEVQRGDALVTKLLVSALFKNLPETTALAVLRDFDEQTEDTLVRAMNDSMPEAFFRTVQASRDTWLTTLRDCVGP